MFCYRIIFFFLLKTDDTIFVVTTISSDVVLFKPIQAILFEYDYYIRQMSDNCEHWTFNPIQSII